MQIRLNHRLITFTYKQRIANRPDKISHLDSEL